VRSGAQLTLRNDANDYPFHDLITAKTEAELFKLLMIETDKQLHAEHVRNYGDAVKFKLSWNTPGRGGMTPLMMAVIRNNKAIFDLLMAHDVSIAVQDAKGNTALHYALIKSDDEFIFKLIQNRNFDEQIFDIRNNEHESPVLLAVKQGLLRIVQHMQKSGASLMHQYGESGSNLLHMAAYNNDQQMTEYLLAQGLSPERANKAGIYPYQLCRIPKIRRLLYPSVVTVKAKK